MGLRINSIEVIDVARLEVKCRLKGKIRIENVKVLRACRCNHLST